MAYLLGLTEEALLQAIGVGEYVLDGRLQDGRSMDARTAATMEEASWGFPIHGIGRRRLVEMGFCVEGSIGYHTKCPDGF
jgi:hypothetical protein